MSARRVIAIARSTQGEALARAVLDDPATAYAVREIDGRVDLVRDLHGAYGAFFVDGGEAAAIARAARAAAVEHLVWSTPDDAGWLFKELGVPATVLLTCACWEELLEGLAPLRGADGRLVLSLPAGERKVPWIAAQDIGKCAYGVFKAGRTMIGRTVGIAGEHLGGRELAAALARALGEPVDYVDRDRATRDVNVARSLNPALQRFDDWLRANAKRVPR